MARTERLLDLLQELRNHRYAVTADTLARTMGVTVRTIYRDIQTLQAQGAPIEGEAGVGYVLRPGFTLPPLMFTVDELEALVLGVSWVADRADPALGRAARQLAAKVKAVLPAPLRLELESTTLLVGPADTAPVDEALAAVLRKAIREQRKLRLAYRDDQGRVSDRTVWPVGLGYFETAQLLMAWCELRQDFRHFRADRITQWHEGDPYPEPRGALLERWRVREGLQPSDL